MGPAISALSKQTDGEVFPRNTRTSQKRLTRQERAECHLIHRVVRPQLLGIGQ
jgi:hypothetical protein